MIISTLFLGALAVAQTPSHALQRLPEGATPPVIDGLLDDAAWQLCQPLTEMLQVEPVSGAGASERTEVLLLFTATDLYIGLRCFDSNPAGLRATQMARDANLDPDDRVELLFDTFHDKRTAYWFQIGAAGSKGDALVGNSKRGFNKRWDTIWYARTSITDEGWFAELRIPFASLNFDAEGTSWGFNIRRHIRRKNEEVRWASWDPRLHFFSVSSAGTLAGLSGLEQGVGLNLTPFIAGARTDDDTGSHGDLDLGLDLFYRLSPNTKLTLSFNTDFAETEVDARQVNLTRFPLFFPEKRKFFLEDSAVFSFGSGGNALVPFFSRRIGLDSEGETVPLLTSAKLTSTTEDYSYGILNSVTGEQGALNSRNLFAGRFAKNIFEQSRVGVLFTHGSPIGDQESYTAGVDLHLRSDTFRGSESLRFGSHILKTGDSGSSGDDLAYRAGISYPNDEVDLSASYSVVEENFAPALGFVRRTGIREYQAEAEYRPRLHTEIRRLLFEADARLITDISGHTESAEIGLIPLGIEWESGDSFRLSVTPQRENLTDDFDIADGVVILRGTHDFLRYGIGFSTADKRPMSAEVDATLGSFYDGSRTELSFDISWRASPHATFEFEYDFNDVKLDGGDFQVNLVRTRADFFFSTFVSWSNFAQWDDLSRDFGINSRLRYIFEPGREFFLVLNRSWNAFDNPFAPSNTDLRFKLAYNVRF